MKQKLYFYKKDPSDKIWWVDNQNPMPPGERLFSFDKKKIYNFFIDYPWNLTKEEKELFEKENPLLVRLVKSRTE